MLGAVRDLRDFFKSAWLMAVTYAPGESGAKLRYRYWKKRLRYLGENAQIDEGVFFVNPQFIHIGENSWIDKNVIIMAGPFNSKREKRTLKNSAYPGDPGVVFIGKNCHIGAGGILLEFLPAYTFRMIAGCQRIANYMRLLIITSRSRIRRKQSFCVRGRLRNHKSLLMERYI